MLLNSNFNCYLNSLRRSEEKNYSTLFNILECVLIENFLISRKKIALINNKKGQSSSHRLYILDKKYIRSIIRPDEIKKYVACCIFNNLEMNASFLSANMKYIQEYTLVLNKLKKFFKPIICFVLKLLICIYFLKVLDENRIYLKIRFQKIGYSDWASR